MTPATALITALVPITMRSTRNGLSDRGSTEFRFLEHARATDSRGPRIGVIKPPSVAGYYPPRQNLDTWHVRPVRDKWLEWGTDGASPWMTDPYR